MTYIPQLSQTVILARNINVTGSNVMCIKCETVKRLSQMRPFVQKVLNIRKCHLVVE